ncbi:MAG: hypothetical protein AAGA36_06625 [Pseudomonadota bacterium]
MLPKPYINGWTVTLTDDTIGSSDFEGTSQSISKDDLHKVVIVTDSSGPWGEDLIWLGYDIKGELAFGFPLGAKNEQDFIRYLTTLPGYDDKALVNAMSSTSEAYFIIWQRP